MAKIGSTDRPTTSANGRDSLRILVFSTDFLPGSGGVQKHIFLFAADLTKQGHHTTVVTDTPSKGFDDSQLPFPVLRQVGLIRLVRLIASADVIHLAGPPFIPMLIGLLLGKPVVIEHHGYQAICPNGLLLYEPDRSACPGHFMKREYDKCLRCVATSQGSLRALWQLTLAFPRRWLCKHGAGYNVTVSAHVKKRLDLPRSLPIYHGIPDPLSADEPAPPVGSSPPCFAYVGRLVAEKGLHVLVEAAARLRKLGYHFRLKFVGDGAERTPLERMVAELGLSDRVTFTGFLSGEKFDQSTEDVAVVVMPSIMEETAGLAAMEQMMRGRLVIASEIGGLGEIVGTTGLKFSVGNVEQLAACMQRVLDDPGIVHEIGQRARRRALEIFTEERKTRTYLALYRRLLGFEQKANEPAEARLLNLLLFTHDWAPSVGGIQTVYSKLASRFSAWPGRYKEGAAVRVTLVTQTAAQGMQDSELPFRVIRKPGFWRLLRSVRAADVVHIGGPALLPLAAAVLLRKPTVLEHHGYQCVCPNGLLLQEPERTVCPGHFMRGNYGKCLKCNSSEMGRVGGFANVLLTFPRRWLARRATVNVVPSNHIGNRLVLPRSLLIRHGIPETEFSSNGHRSQPSGRSACFAYVGRLVREKGITVLFEAAARLSQAGVDVCLKIIGDGYERPRLERLAAELGLAQRIEFLGAVEPERIDGLLAGVDAVVIPSICEDVAPLVAIEQMMQGRLIIGSDLGGLSEILEGVGLKFTPGDAVALESAMRYVLESPDFVQELRRKAQNRARELFVEDRMVSEHVSLYETLVQSQAS